MNADIETIATWMSGLRGGEAGFFAHSNRLGCLLDSLLFYAEGSKYYAAVEPVYTGNPMPVCYLIQLVDILMRLPRSPWFPIFRMI